MAARNFIYSAEIDYKMLQILKRRISTGKLQKDIKKKKKMEPPFHSLRAKIFCDAMVLELQIQMKQSAKSYYCVSVVEEEN